MKHEIVVLCEKNSYLSNIKLFRSSLFVSILEWLSPIVYIKHILKKHMKCSNWYYVIKYFYPVSTVDRIKKLTRLAATHRVLQSNPNIQEGFPLADCWERYTVGYLITPRMENPQFPQLIHFVSLSILLELFLKNSHFYIHIIFCI